MKHLILFGVLFYPVTVSLAQNATLEQLEVGPIGSNQVIDSTGFHSGAIGLGNSVKFLGSLALGSANEVFRPGSMAIGSGNHISAFVSLQSEPANSFLLGVSNYCEASQSMSVGSNNWMASASHEQPGASHNFIIGAANASEGHVAFIFGTSNAIGGFLMHDSSHPTSTAVLGHGLISEWSYATIVGRYNDASLTRDSGLLFAVGNGESNIVRSNALEIYNTGLIVIPRQGDISMGEFGQSEP